MNNEEKVKLLSIICREFQAEGRYDLMLQGIGGANLERLCVEAARANLSGLRITSDYRFILTKWNREVELSPLHKALYILFLKHEEGIEFKRLPQQGRHAHLSNIVPVGRSQTFGSAKGASPK